jgi:hypothetical protein
MALSAGSDGLPDDPSGLIVSCGESFPAVKTPASGYLGSNYGMRRGVIGKRPIAIPPTTLRRILNSCFVGASIDARQGDDE